MLEETHRLLLAVLGLSPNRLFCRRDTKLLGEIPELDSMAVVSVLTAIEEQFEIEIMDDEVDAEIFENLGALSDFVEGKLAGS